MQTPDRPTKDPARPWELYGSGRRWFYLAVLFLTSTSNYIDRQVMSVLLEPIKTEFGASDTEMGLLGGFAFAACYAVLGLPIARLADRGNRRTVIAASLAAWSVMTMACGAARNFPQMFLARIGVGIGEAGAIPPAQSLIADYFPPAQRARALSLFIASATVGYLGAFIGGAQLAAHHGWRIAFVALGAPGLVLAVITWAGLSEPRLLPGHATASGGGESFRQTLAALAAKRSFVLLCVAFVLYYFACYGVITWFPAYLVRVMKRPLTDVGFSYGLVAATATLSGTLLGGIVTDRLTLRDPRWSVRAPGLMVIGAWPFYTFALITESYAMFLGAVAIAGLAIGAGVPAMFAVIQRICGAPRRAMAVAIVFFFANLLGLGFGPLITGFLSDMFTQTMGPVGLRYALILALTILLPTGGALLAIAPSLERDCED